MTTPQAAGSPRLVSGQNRTDAAGVPQFHLSRERMGEEMAAWDALGPRARRALNEAPLKLTVLGLLMQLHARGLDPQAAPVDRDIEASIRQGCARALAGCAK